MKAQLHFSRDVNEVTALQEACADIIAEGMSLWEQYVIYDIRGPHRTRVVTRILGYLHGMKRSCHVFGRPDLVRYVQEAELDFLDAWEALRNKHQVLSKKSAQAKN